MPKNINSTLLLSLAGIIVILLAGLTADVFITFIWAVLSRNLNFIFTRSYQIAMLLSTVMFALLFYAQSELRFERYVREHPEVNK